MARVQAMVTTHLGGAAVRPAVMVREIPHLEGSVDGGDGGNRRRRVGVVHGLSRRSRGGLFSRRRARWPPRVLNGDGVLPASILARDRGETRVRECGGDAREGAGQEEEREMEQQHSVGLRPPRAGGVARSGRGCSGNGAAALPSWRCL